MKRRDFIFCLSGIGALVPLYKGITFRQNFLPENDTSNYKFLNSNSNAWINTKLPERKRSPFGWDYFEIPASSGEHVAFTASEMPGDFKGKIYLRLLIALEVRDKREIGVYLGKSGISIGTIPVW